MDIEYYSNYGQLQEICGHWYNKAGLNPDQKIKINDMCQNICGVCCLWFLEEDRPYMMRSGLKAITIAGELVEENILPENTYLIICRSLVQMVKSN